MAIRIVIIPLSTQLGSKKELDQIHDASKAALDTALTLGFKVVGEQLGTINTTTSLIFTLFKPDAELEAEEV